MKPTNNSTLEVISPKVQVDDEFITTDYDYQTSHVKRTADGQLQAGWICSPAQMRTRLHWEKNIHHLDDEIVAYFVSSPA
ncbi:GD10255 [Drosophila simulans]|uniref:GD10255 n=1 Tax=Drosophila simulans TaxID=7240 RepID=B4QEA6_DROSI|nr:GD10255 [Drosophila simulans]